MEYTVHAMAVLSGVSKRTLRYYDQIGLLTPLREALNGYRIYGRAEVERLQQILFYRELGVSLTEIKGILDASDFDAAASLGGHLERLTASRARIDALIQTVEKTILAQKGENHMTDKEKFEGFKERFITENEQKYGAESREKYGSDAVNALNVRIKGMSEAQFAQAEALQTEFEETLRPAFEIGDPACVLAQKACLLHKQWLCIFYDKYSKAYHQALGEMYVADDRFRANYDKIAPYCTEFLRDAIAVFCAE